MGTKAWDVASGAALLFLTNLVANAIKYRSSRPLVVRIVAVERPGRLLVTVEDNGIGFDPVHAGRLTGEISGLS
mgnify:CR=1 FL=1